MSRWPLTPNADATDDVEWVMRNGGFWDYVDSQAISRPKRCSCTEFESDPSCPNWSHQREDERCLASNSSHARCNQAALAGTPFCPFHLGRAWDALYVASTEEMQRRHENHLTHLETRLQQDTAVLHARLGYENALRMDVVGAAAKVAERVYFYAAGHAVKIGRSVNPERRVRTLKGTLAPEDVDVSSGRLLGTVPGGHRVEHELHIRFRPHRLTGEWFALAPLQPAIDQLLGSIVGEVAS